MSDNLMAVLGIAIIVAICFAWWAIKRLFRKGADAVERKIFSKDAKEEDELLKTVVTFITSTSIADVRQAVSASLENVKATNPHFFKITSNEEGFFIEYNGTLSIISGDGFQGLITLTPTETGTIGTFTIPRMTTSGAVSGALDLMRQLRNSVIEAFQSVDSNVKVVTSQQEITKKLK